MESRPRKAGWMKRLLRKFYFRIVREKASPEYIARGWAIGMFFGCLIPFGLQLACSIPTALWLKGSKIGAIFGTLLTNQVTIFFIYPLQCYVGSRILGSDLTLEEIRRTFHAVLHEQSYHELFSLGTELVSAFFIGGALLTAAMTPPTYYFVLQMVRKYRSRMEKRRAVNGGKNRP